MGNKADATSLYNLIQGYQGSIEGRRGDFQGQRKAISDYYDWIRSEYENPNSRRDTEEARGNLSAASTLYNRMLTDPSARGYDQSTVNSMFGRQADALSGARGAFQKSAGQQLAAQGLSNTGAGMRALMNYDTGYGANMRSAARDVELANAEAKRSDLWNAGQGAERVASGWGDIQGREDAWKNANAQLRAQALGMNQSALGGETDLQALASGQYGQMAGQLQQKNRPGFWGNLGSSLAQGFGSGLGQLLAGGPQGG